jgi:hypothetical protein
MKDDWVGAVGEDKGWAKGFADGRVGVERKG